MISKKTLAILLVFLCAAPLIVLAQDMSKEFNGYLVDVTCGTAGKGKDGSNVVTNPEQHTKHCLDICVAAGSGLGITTDENKDGFYEFTPFDDKGNELANALLDKTEKAWGVSIKVTGYIKDKVLYVSTIEETDM